MIELEKYLNTFLKAADQLDKAKLKKMQLEVAVGEVLNCGFLKLYKRAWTNVHEDPLIAKSRIFFSIWASDDSHSEQKLLYNIHALKLRQLHGYALESKKFASEFRADFKHFEKQWPNVNVKYGPLTLMEGWIKIDPENFQQDVLELANNFLTIAPLIDNTLAKFKR